MVGVPRSRGCRQCRKKKKGCDLQQPVCGQCVRGSLDCEYEIRRWTFVSRGPKISKATCTKRHVSQNRSLTRTAAEIKVLDEFWNRYLPQDSSDTVYVDGIVQTPWCRTVQRITTEDEWVSWALKACAFMSLGRLDRNQSYVRYGRNLYGRSLRETNKALQDPRRATSDEILACCKLLGIYETFRLEEDGRVSTQGMDWRRHVEGICRIIELRGPASVATPHGHSLFQDARASAAISGITHKRPNFFTRDVWNTMPWTHHRKTMRDEFFDVLIALPAILQKQDQLYTMITASQTPEDRTAVVENGTLILKECISLGSKLHAWEQKLLQLALSVRREANDNQNSTPPLTIRDICKNHGFTFFHLTTQLWTATITLSAPAHLTHAKLSQLTTNLTPLPPYMNSSASATNISQTAAHFFSPSAGLLGAQLSTIPLGTALHYYAATKNFQSVEMQTLKASFENSTAAAIASDFLRSIAADADARKRDPRSAKDHMDMASDWYDSTTIAPANSEEK